MNDQLDEVSAAIALSGMIAKILQDEQDWLSSKASEIGEFLAGSQEAQDAGA